jgi:uncharacterized protein YbjT (DUF2867 family)
MTVKTVAIAGAGGFVGQNLCKELVAAGHHVVALGRSDAPSSTTTTLFNYRKADLFSLLQVEQALSGAEVGVYLVHSMMPAAKLTQGKFEDLDLVLADNFARAAKRQKLKRIVYLGGLIPENTTLSRHLLSRCEVERVLASTGIPVVTLRAGLIVGPGGSSLQILVNLVRRLPVMICPRWTQSRCQPIALDDTVCLLKAVILDDELPAKAYDIGGPDILTYRQMLKETAAVLKVRRPMISVPWFSPALSALWVAKVTGSAMPLVRPLVGSLRHDMIVKDRFLNVRYGIDGTTFRDAMSCAIKTNKQPKKAHRGGSSMSVCSVQRVTVPSGSTVAWVANTYVQWVSLFLRPLIDARRSDDGSLHFYVRPLGIKSWTFHLLTLEYSASRSTESRSLFYIRGGLLAGKVPGRDHSGRFEFRRVPDRDEVVVAVLDFRPSLHWWLYKMTQAVAHSVIMQCFAWRMRSVKMM